MIFSHIATYVLASVLYGVPSAHAGFLFARTATVMTTITSAGGTGTLGPAYACTTTATSLVGAYPTTYTIPKSVGSAPGSTWVYPASTFTSNGVVRTVPAATTVLPGTTWTYAAQTITGWGTVAPAPTYTTISVTVVSTSVSTQTSTTTKTTVSTTTSIQTQTSTTTKTTVSTTTSTATSTTTEYITITKTTTPAQLPCAAGAYSTSSSGVVFDNSVPNLMYSDMRWQMTVSNVQACLNAVATDSACVAVQFVKNVYCQCMSDRSGGATNTNYPNWQINRSVRAC